MAYHLMEIHCQFLCEVFTRVPALSLIPQTALNTIDLFLWKHLLIREYKAGWAHLLGLESSLWMIWEK
jgi:hypothetical protein